MFIIVNKDFSIAQIAPSTVYQGSNLANELAIFAPFSVTAYTIEVAIALPSGEYLSPQLAFPTATQPDGFGAWSMEIPSTVTAVSGTAKLSLSFIGVRNAKMVTAAAEFSVYAAVPTVPPFEPSQTLYDRILSYVAEVLSRKPNWSQNNPNADDYIANKPPIVSITSNNEVVGAAVDGEFSAEELTVGGVNFNAKLDKATSSGTAVYAVEGSTQKLIATSAFAQIPGSIPIYSDTKTMRTEDPSYPLDAVNLRYLQDQLRSKVLPSWVSNLTAPNIDTTIPPTSGAVIRYASPAIIGEASGTALLIDDYSSISGQTVIRASVPDTVTSVLIYGRNLFNISAVTAQVGDISVQTDSFTWTTSPGATGTFFVRCPVDIPANATFTFSFDWSASSPSDVLGRVRFYNGSTEVGNTATGVNNGTFTFDQPITHINIYKNPSNTALSGVVTISNPTVNIGTLAEYTSYSEPTTRSVINGIVAINPTNSDGITIIPTTPAVISASYTRDSTKVINKLFDLIAELQDALAN